jgi:hypothetical protein
MVVAALGTGGIGVISTVAATVTARHRLAERAPPTCRATLIDLRHRRVLVNGKLLQLPLNHLNRR